MLGVHLTAKTVVHVPEMVMSHRLFHSTWFGKVEANVFGGERHLRAEVCRVRPCNHLTYCLFVICRGDESILPYKSKTSFYYFTGDGHTKPVLKEVKDQV